MGISNIKTLRTTPPEILERTLGKAGIVIWEKANGIDTSPVRPYSDRKSISTERTFEIDVSDLVELRQKLMTMIEKVAFQLRKKQKLASVITIKIRHSNFTTYTLQKQISYTAFDHILIQEVLGLFDQLYKPNIPLRLVGVKLSGLVSGTQQLNMFEDTPEMTNLYQAIDKVRTRFGENCLKRAVGVKTRNE